MDAILRRIRRRGCVLMLDFDGVLSPIVRTPKKAVISPQARIALELCAQKFPVAIISGRAISDVIRRAGITGVMYAGTHGLEWKLNGRVQKKSVSRRSLAALERAKRALLSVARTYPGLIRENKYHSLAINYRSLSVARATHFRGDARAAVRPYIEAGLVRYIDHLYTFEILPNIEWTKGECARFICDAVTEDARDNPVVVYIGDSLTDEDAFGAFPRGITIRVGKNIESAAKYYFSSRKDVDAFLSELARTNTRR